MIGATIQITGVEETLENLERLSGENGSFRQLYAVIGQELMSIIEERMDGEEDPIGTPWAPLSEKTLRRRRGSSAQILRDTGIMAASLNYEVGDDGDEVRVGFGTFYAYFHEYGTRHMPQRAMLMDPEREGELSETDMEAVIDIITVWATE